MQQLFYARFEGFFWQLSFDGPHNDKPPVNTVLPITTWLRGRVALAVTLETDTHGFESYFDLEEVE